MKMADLVHLNHLLIPVINRFNIKLGFGDATIEEICSEKKINVDFFIEVTNSYHDNEYFPQEHLQTFSITLIVEYLKKTHQYYLEVKIPEIETLINELVDRCYPDNKNIELVRKFFNEYKIEFRNHLKREDEIVFPYALEVEKHFQSKQLSDNAREKISSYSIDEYKREHDDVEEKLFDLKNIIIKYLHSPKDDQLCFKVLNELFFLENDLNNHANIEDKVMVPKVKKMENSLNKLLKI